MATHFPSDITSTRTRSLTDAGHPFAQRVDTFAPSRSTLHDPSALTDLTVPSEWYSRLAFAPSSLNARAAIFTVA